MYVPDKIQILIFVHFLIVWVFLSCDFRNTNIVSDSKADTISFSLELEKLYNIGSLAKYETAAKSHQISSYDTTGGNDDGFSGKYSFLRRNSDSTLVIFDVTGAGVIHRFWTPTPTNDTLDFYIDNPDQITFSIKYIDLFSGDAYPFIGPLCGNQIGGYFCYLPIPFQKSCKIVSRGKKMQFHQIQYKLFDAPTIVKSFSMNISDEEQSVLKSAADQWSILKKDISSFYEINEYRTKSGSITLKPNNSVTIFDHKKAGRILGIELSPITVFEATKKQVDIRITWDNELKPAIYLPAHDFFGYAFGSSSMQSLLLGSQENINYCFFPMPFDERAKIELLYQQGNENQSPINIDYNIYYSDVPRNKQAEGKFYAEWNRNYDPEKGKPHYFLERTGKGHYVGTILQTQGLKAGMTLFFEGDDFTSVDDEPIIHGTGSEDYFNGGWYAFIDTWDTKMSLPIHGALEYSLPMCRTGGYRLFLTDKISFTKNIKHTIEHGPVGNSFPVDYTSVALYYCDSPNPVEQQEPTNELAAIYLPDTMVVYPQLMSYNVWNTVEFESGWKYNTGGLSYIYTVENESKLRIALSDIPYNTYKVYFDITEFDEGCEFSIWQRQSQLSPWIKSANKSTSRIKELYVCDIDIRDFKNTLTIRFKTDEKHKKLFLNRMILVKKNS